MVLHLNIRIVPGRYAVCRLDADTEIPDWLSGPGFKAVIYSDDEVTLVCRDERVPGNIPSEKGWASLRTVGPFPFEAAGIVKALIDPISSNGIGVFVICTFDGEHLLVPSDKLNKVMKHLGAVGHEIIAES